MNRAREEPLQGESERVTDVYAGYAQNRRKAGAWSAANAGNRAMREELWSMILDEIAPELSVGDSILDVGCGTGWCLARLGGEGVAADRLHGVDIIAARVEATQRRVPGADIRHADARGLPFDDGQFGVVLLLTALSSMRTASDIRRAIGQAGRVLRPEGLLLCYEPRISNPLNPHTRLVRLADFRAGGLYPTRVRSLTVASALARTATDRVPNAYPILARIPFLRTHRLVTHRRPAEVAP